MQNIGLNGKKMVKLDTFKKFYQHSYAVFWGASMAPKGTQTRPALAQLIEMIKVFAMQWKRWTDNPEVCAEDGLRVVVAAFNYSHSGSV